MLGGSLAFSLILGAVPVLRGFWVIAMVLSAALVVYMVLLARFSAALSGSVRPGRSDEPSFEMLGDWDRSNTKRSNRGEANMPWVRLLVDEQSA